jgi:hypothetical protein
MDHICGLTLPLADALGHFCRGQVIPAHALAGMVSQQVKDCEAFPSLSGVFAPTLFIGLRHLTPLRLDIQ